MSIRTVSVIMLAIICGSCAAIGLNLVMNKPTTVVVPVATTSVVVAKLEILRGNMITEDAIEVRNWPTNLVPVGIITNLADAKERAALQTMLPGEPIFETKLAPKGAVGGMANLIPTGKRAYTIQTKTVASNVAGFVLPGNLVDVLLTFRSNANDETGGGSTTTLLQSVEVMAVGGKIEKINSASGVSDEVKSVTLLVKPEEVARLDLGQSLGILSLALRNPNDKGEDQSGPATIKDIRFSQMKPDAVKFPPVEREPSAPSFVTTPHAPERIEVPEPPRRGDPKPDFVLSSIRTLRGQSWGEVRVAIPTQDRLAPEPPKP